MLHGKGSTAGRPPWSPVRVRPPAILPLALCLAAMVAAPAAAEDPRWVGVPEKRTLSERDRERMARHALVNARALRRQGRFEMAEAVARRGLSYQPDDAVLHRELALSLEALGRTDAALRERSAADSAAPPPAAPPEEPLALPSRDILVVLLPPPADAGSDRRPRGWPDGPAAIELEARLHTRLPEATVVHAVFDTVEAAKQWLPRYRPRAGLSLRVDRVYCGESLKDGRFGIAWLRVAAERAGDDGDSGPAWARVVGDDPRLAVGCERAVSARALEQVLALAPVREALAAPAREAAWSRSAVRTLFPQLGAAIDARLAEGHAQLARGRLETALARFREAAVIDPDDPIVQSYRREAEATLAMSRELSRRRGEGDDATLAPRLTAAQLVALESSLTEELRRREELLATLAVLEDDVMLPPAALLAQLRPVAIEKPEAFGPDLARRRAGGTITARAAFAPDGSEIARYYFPESDPLPVLREEDSNRDGRADRWIAYRGNARTEIWEDGHPSGRPDVRLVFTAGGRRLLRVELDRDRDGAPERIFHYSAGTLTSEARDSDGDGRLDTFDRLAADGSLALREEDLDGDGEIDVRSHYEDGKLKRREL